MTPAPINELTIYTDGACSGNPGPAGIGVVLYHKDEKIKEISASLGDATNNVAEYTALIYGLQEALKLQAQKVRIFTDSELMFKQIQGMYKVKHPGIKTLFDQVMHLKEGFAEFTIRHILREKNKEADKLATGALKSQATQKELKETA